jgi:Tfp pilus assembly protein PilN
VVKGDDVKETWKEFKETVLPYLVAVLVVVLTVWLTDRERASYKESNERLTTQIEALSNELGGIRELMSKQGYVLPPQKGSQ